MSDKPNCHQARRPPEQPSRVIRQLIKNIANRVVAKLKAEHALRSGRPQDESVPIDEEFGAIN